MSRTYNPDRFAAAHQKMLSRPQDLTDHDLAELETLGWRERGIDARAAALLNEQAAQQKRMAGAARVTKAAAPPTSAPDDPFVVALIETLCGLEAKIMKRVEPLERQVALLEKARDLEQRLAKLERTLRAMHLDGDAPDRGDVVQ